jgi:hypothetical protein
MNRIEFAKRWLESLEPANPDDPAWTTPVACLDEDQLKREYIRLRRKQRQQETKLLVAKTYRNILEDLSYLQPNAEFDLSTTPPTHTMTTATLSALLRLSKRLLPMREAAQRELNKRYREREALRRKELKRAYKAKILAELDKE